MQIGEKIKKLRTAKLMTQNELVGGEITRNMLSRIENGAAQPSMATVKYIAQRLNVSVGFLLAEEEDEILYFKSAEINNIKKAYVNKDYLLCREMCINSEWKDDELIFILSESCIRSGIRAFAHGALRQAVNFFDEGLENCYSTIYNTDHIKSLAQSYFDYMCLISPTLDSNSSYTVETKQLPFLKDPFSVYSSIFLYGEANGYSNVPMLEERLELLDEKSSFFAHISAKLLIEEKNYEEGYKVLESILLKDNYEVPEPMLYFIFGDLEICCKEIEDFKGAYNYSKCKIDLMQKLLG